MSCGRVREAMIEGFAMPATIVAGNPMLLKPFSISRCVGHAVVSYHNIPYQAICSVSARSLATCILRGLTHGARLKKSLSNKRR